MRIIMVHDQSPVDEVTLEPNEPFRLDVTLNDTIGDIKAQILEYRSVPISDGSMKELKLV